MAENTVSCKAKKAISKGSEEEVWSLIDETMENVKHRYPDLYAQMTEELEGLAFKIPYEEARQIVRAMRPKGEVFSLDEVKRMIDEKGIKVKCPVEYYLCMNMMANDYQNTARQFGLERDSNFYFALAYDFINDADGKPYKVQRYFLD